MCICQQQCLFKLQSTSDASRLNETEMCKPLSKLDFKTKTVSQFHYQLIIHQVIQHHAF